MYEVEVKVPAHHDEIEGALAESGATRVGRVEQIDTYFDAPHRDFAETDEALRLRRERDTDGEQAYLTYKGPLIEAESKTRKEFETGLDSPEEAADLLEAMGFSPAATVEKTRTRYSIEGFTVSLDSVAGLGEFVEIEAEATESEVEETRERAVDVLASLGLHAEDQIRSAYLELLLDRE